MLKINAISEFVVQLDANYKPARSQQNNYKWGRPCAFEIENI